MAQGVTCFSRNDTECADMPMMGTVDSVESCCFTVERGGLGGGSYSGVGDDAECMSCMTVVGRLVC